MVSVDDCRLIDLPRVVRREGSITAVSSQEIPFEIVRVFYVYDVPGGADRGAHAHRELHQFFVSMMGSFDVNLDDGRKRRKLTLNRAYFGLYVPSTIWCEVTGFSSGGVCLVLTSDIFKEDDYIRDYDDFLRFRGVDRLS